jgi:uncharacterized membrane protein
MAPLIVLVIATLVARLVGQFGLPAWRDWSTATRVGLALMFCFTAVAHFNAMRTDLVRMVPPWVPAPELMVTFTGICEFLGALGLLVPHTRRATAFALILLLVAVLPANIHAATTEMTLRGEPVTPLVPRMALQVLFIALVAWAGLLGGREPTGCNRVA